MLGFKELYWKITSVFEEWYFKKRYSKKDPQIYYDKLFQCYVHPRKPGEHGCFEYVCSELTESGLFYSYNLSGSKTHGHSIDAVFWSAYNDAEVFSINEEDKLQYSKQELEFIKKLTAQGKKDRSKG